MLGYAERILQYMPEFDHIVLNPPKGLESAAMETANVWARSDRFQVSVS
jgi:hypothetical protein